MPTPALIKALVRERVKDWKKKVGKVLGKKIVEMTGDYTPSMQHIVAADLIIVTPEKWDGVSRHWKDWDSKPNFNEAGTGRTGTLNVT